MLSSNIDLRLILASSSPLKIIFATCLAGVGDLGSTADGAGGTGTVIFLLLITEDLIFPPFLYSAPTYSEIRFRVVMKQVSACL
jgi:hypothetical protein